MNCHDRAATTSGALVAASRAGEESADAIVPPLYRRPDAPSRVVGESQRAAARYACDLAL
jgi:hypothetical protein